jgi:hypothetical protein
MFNSFFGMFFNSSIFSFFNLFCFLNYFKLTTLNDIVILIHIYIYIYIHTFHVILILDRGINDVHIFYVGSFEMLDVTTQKMYQILSIEKEQHSHNFKNNLCIV